MQNSTHTKIPSLTVRCYPDGSYHDWRPEELRSTSIGRVMREAGYPTPYVGKWHTHMMLRVEDHGEALGAHGWKRSFSICTPTRVRQKTWSPIRRSTPSCRATAPVLTSGCAIPALHRSLPLIIIENTRHSDDCPSFHIRGGAPGTNSIIQARIRG